MLKSFSYKKELLLGRDLAFEREQKRYEKVQRVIEKKDAKKLNRWIKQFAGGKEDWLS